MKGKDPAFLFYDGDAARDVSHMNRLERGAYFDLIQAQRKFGGYTVEQARKILGRDFEEVWPSLELILSKDENEIYYIEWVRDSIKDRKEYAEKQSKRIQDYWDRKKKEEENKSITKPIPRNNHGITADIPLEDEDVNEDIDVNIDKGVQGEKVKENIKENYSDFVSMFTVEYEKLKTEFGEDATKKMIDILNNYKGAKGVKYKSDYLAIRNWVIDRYNQERAKGLDGSKKLTTFEEKSFKQLN